MRAPQYLTPEELNYFMRRNRPFKMAWEDMAGVMRIRDIRGVKKWVFAMGWLACAYHFRFYMLEQAAEMEQTVSKKAQRTVAEWEVKSGIAMFRPKEIGVSNTDVQNADDGA